MTTALTTTEVLAGPALFNVAMTAGAFGISTRMVYEQTKADTFVIEPIRFNSTIRFRRTDILEALGIEDYQHHLQAAS